MTRRDRFLALLAALGFGRFDEAVGERKAAVAGFLGLSPRTVSRYIEGTRRPPDAAMMLLELMVLNHVRPAEARTCTEGFDDNPIKK